MSKILTLVCASALASLALAAPAAHATPPTWGINSFTMDWQEQGQTQYSHFPRTTVAAWAHNIGAGDYRTPIQFGYYMPTRNKVADGYWAHYDDIIDVLHPYGIKVIFTIGGSAPWAVPPSDVAACGSQPDCETLPNMSDPDVAAGVTQFANDIATRYHGDLAAIEAWNEPNIHYFQAGDINPARYEAFLTAVRAGIAASGYSVPLLLGSFNNYETTSTNANWNFRDWLNRLLDDGVASQVDAIGWHSYPCSKTPDASWQLSHDYADMDAIVSQHGVSLPYWLTETGITTGGVVAPGCPTYTETEKANGLSQALSWAKTVNDNTGRLPVVLVHSDFTYQHPPIGNPVDPTASEFGLISWTRNPLTQAITVTPKSSFYAVQCKFLATC